VNENTPRPTPADRGGRTDLSYPARLPGYLLGGALVGSAEVVPGVSGGTLALVLGLYDRIITGADHFVRGVVALVRPGKGPRTAAAEMRRVHWSVLIPVAIGMVAAVILGAAIIEPLLEDYPVGMRGLFFGFIAASVTVPLRMAGRLRGAKDWLFVVVAAVLAFVLTGLPPATLADPPLVAVALAASVAVCALVLPGVSGSFFLLSIGLYDTTISAVNDRDLVYLGAFALGAVIGLASFVRLVRWLLDHHRHVTLLAMAGLMVGSLRALWPWQDEDRGLLPPSDGFAGVLGVVAIATLGAIAVLTLSALDARLSRQAAQAPLADPTR
jgi:putative membrane protein